MTVAVITTDWNEIVNLDEYQQDLEYFQDFFNNSLANTSLTDGPYVWIISHLVSIGRYFTRHIADCKDIDLSPFLSLIQKEIGFDLPPLQAIPIRELLRENKSWYSHKGTEVIYQFMADLIKSPVQIRYPSDLIFTLSAKRSCLSGAVTHSGPLPWSTTKLARFYDGVFWDQFVYVVDILQAQNVVNFNDLFAILNNVHPAGLQRYTNLYFRSIATNGTRSTLYAEFKKLIKFSFIKHPYPTLDNNWILDGGRARLSMHGGHLYFNRTSIKTVPGVRSIPGFRTLVTSKLLNNYVTSDPGDTFSRNRYFAPTDEMIEVFSDTDPAVLSEVSTNMSFKTMPYSLIKDKSWQKIRNVAWNLKDINRDTQPWVQDLFKTRITTS